MSQKQNIGAQTKCQPYLREQILKWREERQSRLAARVLHNRQGSVSSAVFGTLPSSKGTKTGMSQPTNASSVSKPKTIKKTKPRNVPEVKHTLASKLRLLKANPLLEVRGIITIPEKRNITRNSKLEKPVKQETARSAKKNNFQKLSQPSGIQSTNKKSAITTNNASNSVKRSVNIRRSLSADAAPRNSTDPSTSAPEQNNCLRRFNSVTDTRECNVSVIDEEDAEFDNDIFPLPMTPVTPSIQTPRKSRCDRFSNSGRKSMVSPSSIFMPTAEMMRKQLSDWLLKRGKSLGNFHHLHCFGLHASNMTSQAANPRHIQTVLTPKRKFHIKDQMKNSNRFSNAKKTTAVAASKSSQESQVQNSSEDKENVCIQDSYTLAIDALEDLVKIVQIGYPVEQCSQWITAIRKEFPDVKEAPVYWECLAAVEEARGDFKSAVDCYERAIIRGASPDAVGNSLDQLMTKFNLLNLHTDLNKDGTCKTPRKQVVDARNIFKSTIIKFALQQKAVRRLSTNIGLPAASLNYYVTPVRRSTRASASRYSVTPGVLCIKSLNQLEPEVRKSMVFEPNQALE